MTDNGKTKRRRPKRKGLLYLTGIDPILKRAFKAACAMEGVDMAEAVRDFMRRKVAQYKGRTM